jgi:hypothetical protein
LVSGLGIKLLILLQFLPAIFTDGALVMLNAECAASRCRRLVLLTSVAYISLPADDAGTVDQYCQPVPLPADRRCHLPTGIVNCLPSTPSADCLQALPTANQHRRLLPAIRHCQPSASKYKYSRQNGC